MAHLGFVMGDAGDAIQMLEVATRLHNGTFSKVSVKWRAPPSEVRATASWTTSAPIDEHVIAEFAAFRA